MMVDKDTRINKWKKYRTNILENHNIKEAIINSDFELKKILKEINFDFSEVEEESILKSNNENNKSYQSEVEDYLINDLLDQINKNECLKIQQQQQREFNSHQYDVIINELFAEFNQDVTNKEIDLKPGNLKMKKISVNKKINIAIDGPSGVGKSSVAKAIAKKLDLVFINTGLMYRAVAFYFIINHLNLNDEKLVNEKLSKIKLKILANEQIELNDENVSSKLWTDEISLAASCVAKYLAVRNFCVKIQQKLAQEKPGVVMEGRDIGTVVLPNANLKIFLSADPEIRAQRRIKQLEAKGEIVNHQDILKNVINRDETDQTRTIAPLEKAKDAIEIDTSNFSLEEVIQKIVDLAKTKME